MNILEIIKRFYAKERLSEKEISALQKWLGDFDRKTEVEEWLYGNWDQAEQGFEKVSMDEIWKKVSSFDQPEERTVLRVHSEQSANKKRKLLLSKISVAASVAVVLMAAVFSYYAGFYLIDQEFVTNQVQPVENSIKQQNVILSSDDGDHLVLNKELVKIEKGNIRIEGNNKSLVLVEKKSPRKIDKKQRFSTIEVPYGKDYYLKLSDGTQVWLNAGTKLRFPDFFLDGHRAVELEGEAYFIVESDVNRPFYVETNYSKVRVTGTQFNVCAYNDEASSAITLVEGKVDVNLNEKEHRLKPGEQLHFLKENGEYTVRPVDTFLYTSWRDGFFEFRDIELSDLVIRLQKWYDVDFQFNTNDLKKLRFTGMVKKEHSVNYFLKVLEKTTNISFEINEQRVLIKEQ